MDKEVQWNATQPKDTEPWIFFFFFLFLFWSRLGSQSSAARFLGKTIFGVYIKMLGMKPE